MGTTAATLLGGFSLATVALLVTAERQPYLMEWALVAFVAASVTFMFCVQFTVAGMAYSASPEERLMWRPLARSDSRARADVERIQRMDARLQHRYFHRARLTYRFGLFAFLAGILLICIPENANGPIIVAITIAGIALTLEVVWTGANILGRYPKWLLPTYAHPEIQDAPQSDS